MDQCYIEHLDIDYRYRFLHRLSKYGFLHRLFRYRYLYRTFSYRFLLDYLNIESYKLHIIILSYILTQII